jgi:hypothetical protein
VQYVRVEERVWIANMVAQEGIYNNNGVPPIRYEALADALESVALEAEARSAEIHMPRIGTERAGGNWYEIEPMISRACSGLNVVVYDLPGSTPTCPTCHGRTMVICDCEDNEIYGVKHLGRCPTCNPA